MEILVAEARRNRWFYKYQAFCKFVAGAPASRASTGRLRNMAVKRRLDRCAAVEKAVEIAASGTRTTARSARVYPLSEASPIHCLFLALCSHDSDLPTIYPWAICRTAHQEGLSRYYYFIRTCSKNVLLPAIAHSWIASWNCLQHHWLHEVWRCGFANDFWCGRLSVWMKEVDIKIWSPFGSGQIYQ